jgi:hypothetical protein
MRKSTRAHRKKMQVALEMEGLAIFAGRCFPFLSISRAGAVLFASYRATFAAKRRAAPPSVCARSASYLTESGNRSGRSFLTGLSSLLLALAMCGQHMSKISGLVLSLYFG